MMPIIDKTATRENIPAENTLAEAKILDFTVPVIDNFGDMGFALSLAVSLLEKKPELRIRLFSENRELFAKMLGNSGPERLEYYDLSKWGEAEHSETRLNFFGYKIRESDVDRQGFPRRVLNFDYLQFHRHGGPTDPGIASIHGMRYEVGATEVVHIVPSPLEEGAGVVAPGHTDVPSRSNFLQTIGANTDLAERKWCSVFTYPPTLEKTLEQVRNYPEWMFLICGTAEKLPPNAVCVPFLNLSEYSNLLRLCDANIVRGENSLVGAMLAGKPFLWDIYRESNGAHAEKIRDFGAFVDAFVPWSETLVDFTNPEGFGKSLDMVLAIDPNGFEKLRSRLLKHDIAAYVLAELSR